MLRVRERPHRHVSAITASEYAHPTLVSEYSSHSLGVNEVLHAGYNVPQVAVEAPLLPDGAPCKGVTEPEGAPVEREEHRVPSLEEVAVPVVVLFDVCVGVIVCCIY